MERSAACPPYGVQPGSRTKIKACGAFSAFARALDGTGPSIEYWLGMEHLTRKLPLNSDSCRFAARLGLLLAVTTGPPLALRAEVRLPKVFSSHMVLQREQPVGVWGWADPNESVTVRLGAENRQIRADDKGQWKVTLPAMKAGGPLTLTVSASNSLQFEDVMIGEVWLASGQSNMEMGIGAARDGKAEIAAANYPGIRLLMVPNRWTPEPQSDMEGTWKVCTPQTVAESGWGGFSAAAYYFGRELHKELGVTVGLIDEIC